MKSRADKPMYQTIRFMGLAGTDVLGLSLAMGVIASLTIPDIAPARLQTAFGTGTSQSVARSRDQADCLWLAARDYGFYNIQHDAVTGEASDGDTALWLQFLDSTGSRECGPAMVSVTLLKDAMAASLDEADRHFRSTTEVHYSSL